EAIPSAPVPVPSSTPLAGPSCKGVVQSQKGSPEPPPPLPPLHSFTTTLPKRQEPQGVQGAAPAPALPHTTALGCPANPAPSKQPWDCSFTVMRGERTGLGAAHTAQGQGQQWHCPCPRANATSTLLSGCCACSGSPFPARSQSSIACSVTCRVRVDLTRQSVCTASGVGIQRVEAVTPAQGCRPCVPCLAVSSQDFHPHIPAHPAEGRGNHLTIASSERENAPHPAANMLKTLHKAPCCAGSE
uniref:Uncharacterized protein n=1 Tax=Junco hyemalis TaxID=40217 RepID=A0A8C5ITW2_JUNHY